MNAETLRTLLDTIDQLDGTLDVLNLSGDSLLDQQQDNLPYGAIHNALMVCIETLLAQPGVDVKLPTGLTLAQTYRDFLFDLSAIGALRGLVEIVETVHEDTCAMLDVAVGENDHEDEIAELRQERSVWSKVYKHIRDLAAAAA